MRKFMLFILITGFTMLAQSQTRNTNPGNQSATAIKSAPVANGDVLILTMGGKYKIYTTYVNSMITGYYALDTRGNKWPVLTEIKKGLSARALKCYKCFKVVDTNTGVSTEDCKEVTCPETVTGPKTGTKSDKTPGRSYQ